MTPEAKDRTPAEDAPGGLERLQAELEQVRAALAGAEARAAENWDRFLRARADLENYRRRVERDLAATVRRQKSGLLQRILEVSDNLERALAATRGTPGSGSDGEGLPASVLEGFELIYRQLQATLAQEGLEPIEALGQAFDPALHEAVVVWESPEATAPTVTDELQKGYRYGGDVLRPARVRVVRPASAGTPAGETP